MRRAKPYDAFPMLWICPQHENQLDNSADITPPDGFESVPDSRRGHLLEEFGRKIHTVKSRISYPSETPTLIKEQVEHFWRWWRIRHHNEALKALAALPWKRSDRSRRGGNIGGGDPTRVRAITGKIDELVSEYNSSHESCITTVVMGHYSYMRYDTGGGPVHPGGETPHPGITGIGRPLGVGNTRVIMSTLLDIHAPGMIYAVNGNSAFRAQSPVSVRTTMDRFERVATAEFVESYGYFYGNDPGFKIALQDIDLDN
ncbi:MAG: hypothetical protein MPI93_04080 [Nitrosopumilus sp.]|nr:hypothetical protein [Nitrosopumilus sp.]